MHARSAFAESSIQLPPPERELAYYTVADARYFVGLAGLLNSLRRVGEDAPLFVVDCGLTPDQRQRLSDHAVVIPRDGNLHPVVQKATGPLAHPAQTMVFIDADVLVTSSLQPLIAEAGAGRFVAFQDFYNHDRFFDEWSSPELGQVQHRPYLNSGLFAFSWQTARELLPALTAMQRGLDLTRTFVHRRDMQSHPYFYADQDLLNALLCARYEERATRLDRHLFPFPPFAGVEVSTDGPPLCRSDSGVTPLALHHIHRKPWLAPLPPNAYSRLLSMLLSERDACLRLEPSELPLRLRDHPLAPLDQFWVSCHHRASQRLRGKLKIRPRIRQLVRAAR